MLHLQTKSQERGYALLMSLMVTSFLLVWSMASLTTSVANHAATNRYADKQRAFQLAEARLNHVLWVFTYDPSSIFFRDANGDGVVNLVCPGAPDPAQVAGTDCVCPTVSDPTLSANTTCGLLDLTPNPDPFSLINNTRIVKVRTTGTTNGTRQTLEAVVQVRGASIFQWPLFGSSGVGFVAGANLVDGYDSTAGPYPYAGLPLSAPRSMIGQVRSNNGLSIAQPTSGTHSYLWADASVGAGLNPATAIWYSPGGASGPPYFNIKGSSVAAIANITLPSFLIPGGGSAAGPYNIGDCLPSDPVKVFTVGVDDPSSISVGANCKVTLQGNGQVNLSELTLGTNSALQTTGQMKITTQAMNIAGPIHLTNGSLQIYVDDSQHDNGVVIAGSLINDTLTPRNFLLDVKGSATTQTNIDYGTGGGLAPFYGVIYAPNHAIYAHPGSVIFGSLISGVDVTITGRVHYDRALRGTAGAQLPVILSWQELS